MILYPEVQAKVILQELLRWTPWISLLSSNSDVVCDVGIGIPHATSNDDVYYGSFIPKSEKKL